MFHKFIDINLFLIPFIGLIIFVFHFSKQKGWGKKAGIKAIGPAIKFELLATLVLIVFGVAAMIWLT